ncbi:MAG: hypothetical protein U5R06_16825 [candidate division KSB1 bacterium]|nr:hypothetical protein [candidate division KSB1 bacterium]
MQKKLYSLLLLLLFAVSVFSATTGKITGKVMDAETGEPLPGTNVTIAGTKMGAPTDWRILFLSLMSLRASIPFQQK